jgi:hypothetical protein
VVAQYWDVLFFGNAPSVLRQAVHWQVRAFDCRNRLEVLFANMVGGTSLTL